MTEKGLSSGEISRIVTSQIDEVRKILEEAEYSKDDLQELKEAEKNGKDRKTVLNLINEKEQQLEVGKDLEDAEENIEGLEEILEKLEEDEDLDLDEENNDTLEQDALIEMLGMTSEELKERLKNTNYGEEDLTQILEAEKKVKDREEVKEYLKSQIKRRNLEEDAREAEEDLKNLEEDVKDFEKHEELEKLSESVLDTDSEQVTEQDEEKKEDAEEEEENESEDSEEDEDEEESEDLMDEVDEIAEDLDEPQEEDTETDNDEEDLEKKKEILSELDLEIDEERIEEMSIEDVKELRDEKEKREEMISELSSKGLNRKDLEIASTSDLEKLYDQVFDDEEESEEEKSKEEIREEAEDDLQMLMGAGKGDEENTEDDKDPREQAEKRIEDFKSSITQKFSREDQEEESGDSSLNQSSVKEKLESYKGLDERESAVKTAHIMKGYLEYRLNIDREMTYDELADNLPTEDYEGMNTLADFFRQMQEDEYTQNIRVDSMDDILDACREVVDQLEG